MILTNFNIDVSCAANLVFWETVLSEQLRIWLCLFFLNVKMVARENNRTSSVFYFIIQIVKISTLFRARRALLNHLL